MGRWIDEFKRQEKLFAKAKMTTRNALQMVAYWAHERGPQLSAPEWMPIMGRIMREAPAENKSTFQEIVTKEPLIPNPGSRLFQGLLGKVFDLEPVQPPVNADVRADVLEFAERSAKLLDANAPETRPPVFKPGAALNKKAGDLVFQAVKFLAKKRKGKPRGSAALILAVLGLIVLWNPR